ncbi:MAG: hypothetical protein ABI851_03380 [Saprospiraceae bacterium]
MNFCLCNFGDLETVYNLHEKAIEFQIKNSNNSWISIDKETIAKEIEKGEVWKMTVGNGIVASFKLLYNDYAVWGIRDNNNSIYLHRIVANKEYPEKILEHLIPWIVSFAIKCHRKFIRMDTWSDNIKIREYYLKFNFQHLGDSQAAHPELLPANYSSISLSLLELKINLLE